MQLGPTIHRSIAKIPLFQEAPEGGLFRNLLAGNDRYSKTAFRLFGRCSSASFKHWMLPFYHWLAAVTDVGLNKG